MWLCEAIFYYGGWIVHRGALTGARIVRIVRAASHGQPYRGGARQDKSPKDFETANAAIQDTKSPGDVNPLLSFTPPNVNP